MTLMYLPVSNLSYFSPSLLSLSSSTILIWPGLIAVSETNYEPFEWPSTSNQILFFILNAFTAFLFNLLLNIGVYFTSPLHMKVATICAIPFSFLVDILLGMNNNLSQLKIWGAVLITSGYCLFTAVELTKDEKIRERFWFDVDLGHLVVTRFKGGAGGYDEVEDQKES